MGTKICRESKGGRKKKQKKASYECRNCGEKAYKEKHLCKPKKIQTS